MKPGYMEIAGIFRRKILDGESPPGSQLPSYASVADEYDVNRTTVIRAYDVLRREGLVATRPGKGTVVLELTNTPSTAERINTYAETGSAMRPGEFSTILWSGRTRATIEIAEHLGVKPGEIIGMRKRLVQKPGGWRHISTSYYPQYVINAAPELLEPVTTGGSRELAADRLGQTQDVLEEEFLSRPVTNDEAGELGVPPKTAALITWRLVTLDDGRVLEHAVQVAPGGRSGKRTTKLGGDR